MGWFSDFQLSIQVGSGGSQKGTAVTQSIFLMLVLSVTLCNRYLLWGEQASRVEDETVALSSEKSGAQIKMFYPYRFLWICFVTILVVPQPQFTLYPQTLCTRLVNEKITVYCMASSIWIWQCVPLSSKNIFFGHHLWENIYDAIQDEFVVLSWFVILYCWIFYLCIKFQYKWGIEECSYTSNNMNFFFAISHTFILL